MRPAGARCVPAAGRCVAGYGPTLWPVDQAEARDPAHPARKRRVRRGMRAA